MRFSEMERTCRSAIQTRSTERCKPTEPASSPRFGSQLEPNELRELRHHTDRRGFVRRIPSLRRRAAKFGLDAAFLPIGPNDVLQEVVGYAAK